MRSLSLMALLLSMFVALNLAALEPKETVQKYFDNLKNGDIEGVMSLLADDIVWHQPGNSRLSGIYRGKEAVAQLFLQFMSISENSLKVNLNYLMVNNDTVTALVSFSARRCQYIEVHRPWEGPTS